MPDDADVFATRLGFSDISAFDLALHHERLFLDLEHKSP
jgi:hypothetical protein